MNKGFLHIYRKWKHTQRTSVFVEGLQETIYQLNKIGSSLEPPEANLNTLPSCREEFDLGYTIRDSEYYPDYGVATSTLPFIKFAEFIPAIISDYLDFIDFIEFQEIVYLSNTKIVPYNLFSSKEIVLVK